MSGVLTPAFLYTDGTGSVTFIPTYPPKNKQPFGNLSAVRHDSITTSGKKQSVLERVDQFLTLEFQFVPFADMASWQRFFAWTLMGKQFNYAPDSTVLGTFTTYTLEDLAWDPKLIAYKHFSFTLKLRQFV